MKMHLSPPCSLLSLVLHMLTLTTCIAWYDTSTRPEDIMLAEMPPLPKEHNPRRGVLHVKRAPRHPDLAMSLINSVRTLQEPNTNIRKAREEHQRSGPPVIGHFAPVGSPSKGGAMVKFWGVNFGGGAQYKCRFHNAVVPATYNEDTSDEHHDTIACVAPSFSLTGAKSPDGVDVSIIIFANTTAGSNNSRVHHHSQSHRRRFMYYATERKPPGGATTADGTNSNGASLFAQIFVDLATPKSGPLTGGTLVQIPGRFLLDHKDGYNCRFGGTLVPAVAEHSAYQLQNVVVDEVLSCISPPNPTARKVRFQIEHASVEKENGGAASARIGQKGSFHFYNPPDASIGIDNSSMITMVEMTPMGGSHEGGQVLTLSDASTESGKAGEGGIFMGGSASKYVCRFGGQSLSTGFYDRGAHAIKCLVPPLSSLPVFPDDDYRRIQMREEGEGEKKESSSMSSTSSSTETRGDVYYGDNVWGRSNAALLETSTARLIPKIAPSMCWGTSPCMFHDYITMSHNPVTLFHSNLVEDELNTNAAESNGTFTKDKDKHLLLQRHRCSSMLSDGEQLLGNIYSRIRARDRLKSQEMTCAMLNDAMSMLVEDGSTPLSTLDRTQLSKEITHDVNRMQYTACKIPPTMRKLSEISCDGNGAPTRHRRCHVARLACRTTSEWLFRFDKSSIKCRELCTPVTTPPPRLPAKECAKDAMVQVVTRRSSESPGNTSSSTSLEMSIRWHGLGTEQSYSGREDRLCVWSLGEIGSAPVLQSEIRAHNYYNRLSRAGSALTKATFKNPVRIRTRKIVARYERRLAKNQGGCKWSARNEVCGKTSLIIPYIPPPPVHQNSIAPILTVSHIQPTSPAAVQCKITFDTSKTVVPLTLHEIKRTINYETMENKNNSGTSKVETIHVPDFRIQFSLGFTVKPEDKCIHAEKKESSQYKAGAVPNHKQQTISKDDVLCFWKIIYNEQSNTQVHNWAEKVYAAAVPALNYLSYKRNTTGNVTNMFRKDVPKQVGLTCDETYTVTYQKSNSNGTAPTTTTTANLTTKERHRAMCIDGVEGPNIWGAHAFQAECPCPQPSVHISSAITKGSDNATRIGLRWDPPSKESNPVDHQCYQKRASASDLLCVYSLREIRTAKGKATPRGGNIAPVFADGFVQGWYKPSEIVLPKMPRYSARRPASWWKYGQRYLVRYEPRSSMEQTKQEVCQLPWRSDCLDHATGLSILHPDGRCGISWGQHVVEVKSPEKEEKKRDCGMVGVPPVTALVEISLNGQQFHSINSYYTYNDRAYYSDYFLDNDGLQQDNKPCDVHDERNVFSYSPETIPRLGGTIITLSGVPVDLNTWSTKRRVDQGDQQDERPETSFGLHGSSMFPGSGPCEGGTHVVVMSSNISKFEDSNKNDSTVSFWCQFGVVKVPAHSFQPNNVGESAKLLKDDPDRNTLWCVTPVVMSCGRVPFALLASAKTSITSKTSESTINTTTMPTSDLISKMNTTSMQKTPPLLLLDEELETEDNKNDELSAVVDLGLGESITYIFIDSALKTLGYTPSGVDILMSETRGECSTPTTIEIKGLNLNVDKDRSRFGCRFGELIVPAFVDRKSTTYKNIGTADDITIKCETPICKEAGEVSFAVVLLSKPLITIPSSTYSTSQSPNVDSRYHGSPNKPETDLSKDALYFTYYKTEDNECNPCPPPISSKDKNGPSWNDRAFCVIGGKKSPAFWDPGTLPRTTERQNQTTVEEDFHKRSYNVLDNLASNTRVGRRSPSLKCISPPQTNKATSVPIYLVVDGVKHDQFTYQKSKELVVYGAHTVQRIEPPHGSCGAKLNIHLKPEEDVGTTLIHAALATKPVTVLLGKSLTMVCMYDTSPKSSGPGSPDSRDSGSVRCLQPTAHLPPGGIGIRLSPDGGQNFGYGGARWISYDTPHSGYTGPNRGGINADGTSAKTAVFFLRFAPRSGPLEGGTHVIVTGRDFAGGHGYKCRFGGKEVAGIFRFASGKLAPMRRQSGVGGAGSRGVGAGAAGGGKHGVVLCVSPPMSKEGVVPFGISVNGHEFSCGKQNVLSSKNAVGPCGGFEYYMSPGVEPMATKNNAGLRVTDRKMYMHPTHASSSGGTQITITGAPIIRAGRYGRPMSAHFSCMFGDIRVTGLYDTALASLRCLTPPMGDRLGPILVRVSWNDEQYHLVTGDQTRVNNVVKHDDDLTSSSSSSSNEPVALNIYNTDALPCYFSPSSGPTTGETVITIHGFMNILSMHGNNAEKAKRALTSAQKTERKEQVALDIAKDAGITATKRKIDAVNHQRGRDKEYFKAHNRFVDAVEKTRTAKDSFEKKSNQPRPTFNMGHQAALDAALEDRNRAHVKAKECIEAEAEALVILQQAERRHASSASALEAARKIESKEREKSRPTEMMDQANTTLQCAFGSDTLLLHTPAFTNVDDKGQTVVQCMTPAFSHAGPRAFALQIISSVETFSNKNKNNTIEMYSFDEFTNIHQTSMRTYNIYDPPAILRIVSQPFQTITEVGGKILQLYGTNLTGEQSYVIRFTQLNTIRSHQNENINVNENENENEGEHAPTSSYVEGMYDQGKGYVVVRCPPMAAGLVRLSIGINRQQFRYIPGIVPIHFGTRVHVRPLAATELGSENEVTIFYAPPPHLLPPPPITAVKSSSSKQRIKERKHRPFSCHVQISSIKMIVRNVGDVDNEDEDDGSNDDKDKTENIKHVSKGTLESARVMEMEQTKNFGRYTWRLPYIVANEQIEIEIVRFQIFYEFQLKHNTLNQRHHRPLTPEDQTHSSVWEDDNNAHGFAWRFLMGTDGTTKWLEGATSALQAGAYFNRIHQKYLDRGTPPMLQIRIVGIDAISGQVQLNRTMPGKYLIKEGAVRWVIPASPNFDGRAHVAISFNGGHQWTTTSPEDVYSINRGPSHFAFDARYNLGGGSELTFRLSTEALRSANITYPFNLLGRERFDFRVLFDISESIGIQRDRLVVLEAHSDTGVTKVHCVKSRFVGDPTCFDVANAFRTQIESYGSVAYDGTMTWALDPLFPSARVKFVAGAPYISGACSDERILTEGECLSSGTCKGVGCTLFDSPNSCSGALGLGGQPCQWVPFNTFDTGTDFKPLEYGRCSNLDLKTKEDCLAVGKCPDDPTKTTREECISAGGKMKCIMPPGFEHLNNKFTTLEECEHPELRPTIPPAPGAPPLSRGTCEKPKGVPSYIDYGMFKNRVECEVPSQRPVAIPISMKTRAQALEAALHGYPVKGLPGYPDGSQNPAVAAAVASHAASGGASGKSGSAADGAGASSKSGSSVVGTSGLTSVAVPASASTAAKAAAVKAAAAAAAAAASEITPKSGGAAGAPAEVMPGLGDSGLPCVGLFCPGIRVPKPNGDPSVAVVPAPPAPGKCVVGNQMSPKSTFDFSQFKTKDVCETPSSRASVKVGATLSHPGGNPWGPPTGDAHDGGSIGRCFQDPMVNYAGTKEGINFDCTQFKNKGSCTGTSRGRRRLRRRRLLGIDTDTQLSLLQPDTENTVIDPEKMEIPYRREYYAAIRKQEEEMRLYEHGMAKIQNLTSQKLLSHNSNSAKNRSDKVTIPERPEWITELASKPYTKPPPASSVEDNHEHELIGWQHLIGPRQSDHVDLGWTKNEIVNYHRYWLRWGELRDENGSEENMSGEPSLPSIDLQPRARVRNDEVAGLDQGGGLSVKIICIREDETVDVLPIVNTTDGGEGLSKEKANMNIMDLVDEMPQIPWCDDRLFDIGQHVLATQSPYRPMNDVITMIHLSIEDVSTCTLSKNDLILPCKHLKRVEANSAEEDQKTHNGGKSSDSAQPKMASSSATSTNAVGIANSVTTAGSVGTAGSARQNSGIDTLGSASRELVAMDGGGGGDGGDRASASSASFSSSLGNGAGSGASLAASSQASAGGAAAGGAAAASSGTVSASPLPSSSSTDASLSQKDATVSPAIAAAMGLAPPTGTSLPPFTETATAAAVGGVSAAGVSAADAGAGDVAAGGAIAAGGGAIAAGGGGAGVSTAGAGAGGVAAGGAIAAGSGAIAAGGSGGGAGPKCLWSPGGTPFPHALPSPPPSGKPDNGPGGCWCVGACPNCAGAGDGSAAGSSLGVGSNGGKSKRSGEGPSGSGSPAGGAGGPAGGPGRGAGSPMTPKTAPAGNFAPPPSGGPPPSGAGPPGNAVSPNAWKPKERWIPGPLKKSSCPCSWSAVKIHLTKCNWKSCGPSCKSPKSKIMEAFRLRSNQDMVSEYQVLASVGGKELWMQLETMTGTTHVMSGACFTPGCQETPLFGGLFIPFIPPAFVKNDLLRAGLTQMGAVYGFLGHSMVDLAGQNVFGAPIMMGIIDMGFITGGALSYNHTGAIGLGFWEDNMPNWFVPKDPGLDIITFMMCGNIFFPIPGAPVPIMKPFMMWGIPWYLPSGVVFKFSFYFGDRGGCFFLDPGMGAAGEETFYSEGGLKWIVVMPVAVKFLMPSWLFLLSDAKVNGKSVKPCVFGVCKASVHTGQFSITGPRTPVLKMLQEVAAPKDCTRLDVLPDMSFTLMGTEFSLTRNEYVVYADAFGEKECLTALTPDGTLFGLLEPLSMWIFGDSWVRSFYTVFERVPLKRIGFSKADHRYYEKNGCVCGSGEGPIDSVKPMEQNEREMKEEEARIGMQREMKDKALTIEWKRAQNWKDDLEGMQLQLDAQGTDSDVGTPCTSGMRFKSGRCIPSKMIPEVRALQRFRQIQEEDNETEETKDDDEEEASSPPAVKPQFHFSPARNAGDSANVDTSKPIVLDSAENPMVNAEDGEGGLRDEKDMTNNIASLSSSSPSSSNNDEEQNLERNDLSAVAEFEKEFRQLAATSFIEEGVTVSAPEHHWGPYERQRTEGGNICPRQQAEREQEHLTMDTAAAHEGLFHTHSVNNENKQKTMFLEEEEEKAKNEEKFPPMPDGSHLFMRRAKNEVEKALAEHIGKRHEHGNMQDNAYVSFVEISTKMLAQHHASVHSEEGVWTHTGRRVTLVTDALDAPSKDTGKKMNTEKIREKMVELYKNATTLFDTWRHDMNVTKDSMKGYWRGQDEDWVADAREAAMDLWEERVQKARHVIGASKVKSRMNRRALERALNTLPKKFDRESLEKIELGRLDGNYMNKHDKYGTARPYYPFFDNKADQQKRLDTDNDNDNDNDKDALKNAEHFTSTGESLAAAAVQKQKKDRVAIAKKKRKLAIIKEWAEHSLQKYPDLWSHYEEISGVLKNHTSWEYQALHLQHEKNHAEQNNIPLANKNSVLSIPIQHVASSKEKANKTKNVASASSSRKKKRLVRGEDGSLTQELFDGDGGTLNEEGESEVSETRDVREAREAKHHAATAHAIRKAYSLVESKFDQNRKLADEKLTSLEGQLAGMRKQHEHREHSRGARRNGNLRSNKKP